MRTKGLILTFVIIFFSNSGFCQTSSDYTDAVTKLVAWFANIDVILTKISDKEKLKRIYRQIGYVSEDIDNIALGKEILADELSKMPANSSGKLNNLKPQIDTILVDINNLVKRLKIIKTDVSGTDQVVVEGIILNMQRGLNEKIYYLNEIKRYLFKKDIPLTKIQEDANESKLIAENASTKIKEAKVLIKKKLN